MFVEKDLFLFDSNNQEEEDSFGIHTNIAQTIFNCINKTELSNCYGCRVYSCHRHTSQWL